MDEQRIREIVREEIAKDKEATAGTMASDETRQTVFGKKYD